MDSYHSKYFTENGVNALTERLKTIYAIYLETPEEKYPLQFKMFGFPILVLESKEQTLGHVNELQQILNLRIEVDNDNSK